MAVYTVLDGDEIAQFIEPFGIGPLVGFEGVADGIENTNYFITTDQSDFSREERTEPLQHFVLTLFEEIDAEELRFYINLTTLLNQRDLPVPCPVRDTNGESLHFLQNKPALLIPKAAGSHPTQPTAIQCHEIGQALAQTHRACLDAGLEHQCLRNLNWLAECAKLLARELPDHDRALLEEIPRFLARAKEHSNLPQAIIHNDLFRDNTLYQGDQLTAIIDFNSAGSGYLMLDLAVTVNDWCSMEDGSLDLTLTDALLSGYQQFRSLTDDEALLWNDFLRIAATRFWISRLMVQQHSESNHRPGGLVETKDPEQYKTILQHRIRHPQQL